MKDENAASSLTPELAPSALKRKGHEPIVFVKRDRKPATSSITHSQVLDGGNQSLEIVRADGTLSQEALEGCFLARRALTEIEDEICRALANKADVEPGVHTALLEPARDNDGKVYAKLVIR
ncbi:hypothetical protein SBA5_750003 [Candidatus Sulfotelmatomonas gaucii]|uniref:Uncharacterized protein n=1 Tax=Candidatus Sulfuritelmatomonas gaucii TaxID=2043161 RepID=A0A2N9M3T4_9BACT|nr:hypothetical protein SBA5_750003 [Candidatus Sulfotelmatomonas gaucii]